MDNTSATSINVNIYIHAAQEQEVNNTETMLSLYKTRQNNVRGWNGAYVISFAVITKITLFHHCCNRCQSTFSEHVSLMIPEYWSWCFSVRVTGMGFKRSC